MQKLGKEQGLVTAPRPQTASEAHFRNLADAAPAILWVTDATGACTFISRGWYEATGQREKAALGHGWIEAVHPDDRQAAHDAFLAANDKRQPFSLDYRLRQADGSYRWVNDAARPLVDGGGGFLGYVGSVADIHERKLVEQALRESEEKYRAIFDNSVEGLFQTTPEGAFVNLNPALARIYGYDTPEEVIANFKDIAHQLYVDPEKRQEFVRLIAAHGMVKGFEFEIKCKDGTRRWVSESTRSVRDATGKLICYEGAVEDITERKRAEEALRQSQVRYYSLVESLPVFLFRKDLEGRFTYVNQRFCQLLGKAYDEIIEKTDLDFFPKELAEEYRRDDQRVMDQDAPLNKEEQHLSPDGERRYVQVIKVPVHDHRGQVCGVQGVFWDITERRRAEQERRQLEARIQHAQKLESLGVLAGGIAHDFNNLLTSMLGYANLALAQLPDESPACSMLREIERAAQRAADLTQQMLAYSGRSKFVIRPVRLDVLVQEMTKLLKTVVSKKARLELDLEPATIEGDATQVRQIVMNLITNASDALDGKTGTIRVRTGTRLAEPADLRSPYVPDERPVGRYAYVQVEDDGCGMTAETQARIFDPFFSTKFTGRGLGLAAALGIVRGHRGVIKVKSTPGEGTVFEVLFPSTAAAEETESASTIPPPRGAGTVLLVEDEPSVREFTQRVLEDAGFQVRAAVDGREGLNVFAQHRPHIDAAILDLTMPGMDGVEVLRALRTHSSDLPVLIMSGFSEQEFSQRLAGLAVSGFVQKPFRPRDLIAQVCAMLKRTEV